MSAEEIYKVIYCSRNLIQGTPRERDAEIARILASARAYNSRKRITGALLYNSGCFAQVLEGPKEAVELLVDKISRDSRHGDIAILKSGMADHRDFPEWSMAHVQSESEVGFAGASATLEMALLGPSLSPDKMLELVRVAVLELLRTLVIREDPVPAPSEITPEDEPVPAA
jgi:hypothetical protein